LLTPYNYHRAADGAQVFTTEFGLTYRVFFLEAAGFFRNTPEIAPLVQTFGFEILENPRSEIPHDARVGSTIVSITIQYYEQNPNGVLFFIHDGSDGKQLGRKKKFDVWYRQAGEQFVVKRDAAITIGRITILCSILLRTSHPQLDQIFQGFDQLALEATNKPED
jgi:hypothetical protein